MHSTSQAFNTVDKCIAETNITTLQTYCFLHGKFKHEYIITEVDSHNDRCIRYHASFSVGRFVQDSVWWFSFDLMSYEIFLMHEYIRISPFKTINSLNMHSIGASRFSSISKALKYIDTQSAVNDNTNSG